MILDDDPDRDWTAPGVFRCAPDVYRIPLPLPNDGLRAVNVYAVADGDGFTLVDSGWALAEARELLAKALTALGADFTDVRRFLVTHVPPRPLHAGRDAAPRVRDGGGAGAG